MSRDTTRVGVLALQGAFERHREVLLGLGVAAVPIRTPGELDGVDALVLPGGESSAMLRLMAPLGLLGLIGERIQDGMPVLATCAGVILLAARVTPRQESLGLLDLDIERNAYGRQVFSSIETLMFSPAFGGSRPGQGVFIRAPRVTRVGSMVEVLAWREDDPVLVRTPRILAATFHPELGPGAEIHEFFYQRMCRDAS